MTAPRCTHEGCTDQGVANCSWITFPGALVPFVNVQPLDGPGQPLCLDHVHLLVDTLLIRLTPEPSTIRENP